MTEQLDQAYELIQNDQQDAAIEILEPVIREDRDNEDAWWLLANAYSDPEAKQNALHNVLRVTDNDDRKEKAQAMLKTAGTGASNVDNASPKSSKMSAYQAIDEAPAKSGRGMSCATISLIIVGLVGVCACAAVIGIFVAAGDLLTFLTTPDTYLDAGVIEMSETYAGTLTQEDNTAGFAFEGDAGEQLILTVESTAQTAPFIVIYDTGTGSVATTNNGFSPAFYQAETFSSTLTATFNVPETGGYLVTLRGTTIIGTEFGYGDYILDVELGE